MFIPMDSWLSNRLPVQLHMCSLAQKPIAYECNEKLDSYNMTVVGVMGGAMSCKIFAIEKLFDACGPLPIL